MRIYFTHSRKSLASFLRNILLAAFLLVLVGCSDANNTPQESQPSQEQMQIEELSAENENLRKELDAVTTELEKSKSKIDELEAELSATKDDLIEKLEELADTKNELRAAQENQLKEPETVPNQINVTPPQLSPEEALLGEWFFSKLVENGRRSKTQSMTFYANGTGVISETYYVPESDVELIQERISSGMGFECADRSTDFSWSLVGDTIHVEIANGEVGDFTYSAEEQKFSFNDGKNVYGREKPSVEKYVAHSSFTAANDAMKAKEDAIKRRCIGAWYFDVLIWTFNEDGTGVIDIPELGDQPASKMEFTYDIIVDLSTNTAELIVITWDDGRESYHWPELNSDGSMTLKGTADSEPIKLTRQFDPDNCPLTEEIISSAMGVWDGSIVQKFLGGK